MVPLTINMDPAAVTEHLRSFAKSLTGILDGLQQLHNNTDQKSDDKLLSQMNSFTDARQEVINSIIMLNEVRQVNHNVGGVIDLTKEYPISEGCLVMAPRFYTLLSKTKRHMGSSMCRDIAIVTSVVEVKSGDDATDVLSSSLAPPELSYGVCWLRPSSIYEFFATNVSYSASQLSSLQETDALGAMREQETQLSTVQTGDKLIYMTHTSKENNTSTSRNKKYNLGGIWRECGKWLTV